MDDRRVERRLAAILAADVAGYSRLMGSDEEGTLAALKAHRRELIDPKIQEHHGRIVKTTGDGMLVEYGSVVDALRCAIEVAHGMADRNAKVPADKRIEFRVGINIGDIIIDEDDIHGDGVNVAARLEGLAEPGGICISRAAREQVRDKLDTVFEDMGEQQLKNIARPVRVYRANFEKLRSNSRPALPLPEKPSLAVLPFQNMSDDPEQEYFADGIVEDIITALSRVKSFFVIARNSSFTYKGKSIDLKQVSRELGVRYVLEGSVRKAGNRVRITCQLIEGPTNHHVWADRFEGNLADVFDLQDRTTESVTAAIEPNLQLAEINRIKRKPTTSLSAYDYYLRGMASMYRWSQESCIDALRNFDDAIKVDPEFSLAYAMAARCQLWRWANDWMANRDKETAKAVVLARRALEFGKDDPAALSASGFVIALLGDDLHGGVGFIDRALEINPNLASAWHFSCWVRISLLQPDLALQHELRAIRLSPLDPLLGQMETAAAFAHFFAGRLEDASSWAGKAARDLPNWQVALGIAAASSASVGRLEEAQRLLARMLQQKPALNVANSRSLFPFKHPQLFERWIEGLRLAGLPD